jgi:hypothetical protein
VALGMRNHHQWTGTQADGRGPLAREQSLRQARESLRRLAAKLFHAQKEEHRRIAREMHDDWTRLTTADRTPTVVTGAVGEIGLREYNVSSCPGWWLAASQTGPG